MLKATINDILTKKFLEWANTITDPYLKDKVLTNAYIAGGAILSLYKKEEPNDLDIYFQDFDTAKRLLKYYNISGSTIVFTDIQNNINQRLLLTNTSYSIKEEKDFYPIFVTRNTLTLNNKIQLVFRYIGDPYYVLSKFDFAHTKMYWNLIERVNIQDVAKDSIISNELQYFPGAYPLSSLFRVKKYLTRGWNISIGQLLKLSIQLAEIDYTNYEILKDQLYGVDIIYIDHLMKMLSENKDTFTIDHIYKAVDKVFQV